VGVIYIKSLVAWSAVFTCIGCVTLILPLSLLANEAAAYQVALQHSGQDEGVGKTSMTAWSTSAVRKTSLSFWLFWVFVIATRKLFSYGTFFSFAIAWWSSSMTGLLRRWSPALSIASLTLVWEFGLLVAISNGAIGHSRRLRLLDVCSRYAVWFVVNVVSFAASAPGGRWCSSIWPAVKMAVGAMLIYLAAVETASAYFSLYASHPTVFLVSACSMLRMARAIITHVYIRTTEALPGSPLQLQTMSAVVINVATLTGCQLLQFHTESLASLVLVQVTQVASEICTNVGLFSCETEVERLLRVKASLLAWMARAGSPPRDVAGREVGPAWAEPAPQRAQQDEGSATSRRHLVAGLVMLSNAAELCTLSLTGLLCLLCRISDLAMPLQRQGWQRILAVFCITLLFELAGDLCVIAWVHKWSATMGQALPTVHSTNRQMGMSAMMLTISLGMLFPTMLLAKIICSMCPLGDQAGRLLTIAPCL